MEGLNTILENHTTSGVFSNGSVDRAHKRTSTLVKALAELVVDWSKGIIVVAHLPFAIVGNQEVILSLIVGEAGSLLEISECLGRLGTVGSICESQLESTSGLSKKCCFCSVP